GPVRRGAPGADHRGRQLRRGHDRGAHRPAHPSGGVSAVNAGEVGLKSGGAPDATGAPVTTARQSWPRLWRLKWGLVAAVLMLLIVGVSAAAPWIAPYSPVEVVLRHRLAPPVIAVLGPSLVNMVIVLGVADWPLYARVIRAETMTLRERDFMTAARALGMSHLRIVFRQLLPNLISVIVVIATLQVARVIILEAFLSFLVLGVPPSL